MSQLSIRNVSIKGISACVPKEIEENVDLEMFATKEDAMLVINSTGIERHRKAGPDVTASDLSVVAVKKLVDELGWGIETVDVLIYVCTSRDYLTPMTSCILQDRLGMRKDSYVMDTPMGCAGWVYGISLAGALVQNGTLKRAVVINAETNTKNRSSKDKTCRPLFGDAATVTALEYNPDEKNNLNFVFGVDGSGASSVMAKFGGIRHPITVESLEEKEIEPGIIRKGNDIVMNGMDVFSFAIKEPPKSLKELVSVFNINTDEVDYLFLHQANKYIDERIRKSLKFTPEKTPYCLNDFGNVAGASIPLTMVTRTKESLSSKDNHCIGCGFGVGLSWASVEFHINGAVIPELMEI